MQSHCLVLPAPPQAELHRQEHSSTTNTPTVALSTADFQEAPKGEATHVARVEEGRA